MTINKTTKCIVMNKVNRVKRNDYTTISNVFLRDTNLSLKAKGLIAIVMSLPDDWDFTINGIVTVVKEGKTAIYSAIKELKENGYCSMEIARDEKGKSLGVDYTFLENPKVENPKVENPKVENPKVENPKVENPKVENPKVENPPQINIDNNKILKENKNDKDKSLSKNDELFEKCWLTYKRKGSKKKAKEYWCKLSDDEKSRVLPHIQSYVTSRELQYQKDFERYLRDKVFLTLVYRGNNLLFDPTQGEQGVLYMPQTGFDINWDETNKCYMYVGYWNGFIPDGYTDDNRPDGATITLNNGRGTVTWDGAKKSWVKK